MTEKSIEFTFNPKDWDAVCKLMDEQGDSNSMFSGKNEEGETVTISISRDNVVTRTFQRNNWCRVNTYWRDGTKEETYER